MDAISDISDSVKPLIELRCVVLPLQPKRAEDDQATQARRHRRDHRHKVVKSQAPVSSSPSPHPHFALPSESSLAFYDVVQQLPLSTLVLSHFSITSAADGSTLCQSNSFDGQPAFNESFAALPLHSPLSITGQADGFNHRHHLFDVMFVSFIATLEKAEGEVVRVAHIDEPSVRLTTSFRLLPSLTLSLSARLGLTDERGDLIVFETVNDTNSRLPQPPLDLASLLAYHRQRVIDAGNEGYNNPPSQEQHSRESVFPFFLSFSPTARLSSFAVTYAAASHQPLSIKIEVQSECDVQMRGFHLVRPCLCFLLHNRGCGEEESAIRGRAEANYTVAGDGGERLSCSTEVEINRTRSMLLKGDCLAVMRMANVLTAHLDHSTATTTSTAASFSSPFAASGGGGSGFSFGGFAPSTTFASSSGSFSFGNATISTSSAAPASGGFSFGSAAPSTPAAGGGFIFGSAAPSSSATTSGFSFGSFASATGGMSLFGNPSPSTPSAGSAPSFTFNAVAPPTSAPSTSTFSFGDSTATTAASTSPLSTLSTRQASASHAVFVGGLSLHADEAALKEFFSGAGEITVLRIPRSRDTGQPRGTAILEFATADGAQKALEMDGQEMLGRWLKVAIRPSPATGMAASLPPAAPPPPLSSFTEVPWTLESTLARQLPWLVPSDPPSMPPASVMKREQSAAFSQSWNRVECSYDLIRHRITRVSYHDLTLGLIDTSSPSSTSSSTPSLSVLLSSSSLQGQGSKFIRLELCPSLQFHYRQPGYCGPADITTTALMPFTQLLGLIGFQSDLVPPALLHRVQFTQVKGTLIVAAATGVALLTIGTAECGPCRRDELLFFHRLAPAAAPPNEQGSSPHDGDVVNAIHSPVRRWLRLQCRPVLDPVVFPQLAELTRPHCLQPLYQYTLCETDGDVEVSKEQKERFETSHHRLADHQQFHAAHPVGLRPTNAVYALQPHLPKGYLGLPAASLTPAVPFNQPLPLHSSSLSSSSSSTSASSSPLSSSLSSGPSRLLAEVGERSAGVFRQYVDFLDLNSIVYGLLPAVHSLPSVSAVLVTSAYWRRLLLSRFGASTDAALWSAELLSEWRVEGFEQQMDEVIDRYQYYERAQQRIQTLCDGLCAAKERAHQHNVHLAAAVDLQTRINKFLIRVMRQKKEDVLPQLFSPPHATVALVHSWGVPAPLRPGTVRPSFLMVPDAAMALLMCVPPFHSLPRCVNSNFLTTDSECSLGESNINNESPHRVDFAGFMGWNGISDGYSLWSLYMGPVYVYDNEWTKGRGLQVDTSESSKDQWGQPLLKGLKKGRAIRQLYIDDVNQLPVTRRMPFGSTEDIHLYAPTLAACFRAKGVTAMIEKRRSKWKAVAEKRRGDNKKRAAEEHEEGDDAEEEEEGADEGEEEEDEGEEDEEDGEEEDLDGGDDAMNNTDGAALEYVDELMTALFHPMHEAMWQQPSWTEEVAAMASSNSRL